VIPVLTADEMRRADRQTIEEIGLPGVVLMENAGAAVAAAVERRFPAARRVVVLCGRGNNGGDGFVVARRLRRASVLAVLLGRKDEVRGDARTHLEAAERSGLRVIEAPDSATWARAADSLARADVLVDALLGTGLRSRPEGVVGEAVEALARRANEGCPVVAVDIPSGVPSDGGTLDWTAPRAVLTVTFAALKRGHVLPPACDLVGEIVVADIGIPAEALTGASLQLVEDADVTAVFPPRAAGAHKGTFGHVLVVAGSLGKSGAAALAASGALRSGAGLVSVATPRSCLALVAASRPEVMTEPMAETNGGGLAEEALDRLLALAGGRDAGVLGPGRGRDASTWRLARAFAARCPVPLVVDADGLNAIAPGEGGEGPAAVLASRTASTIITPHPGEMSRLAGRPVATIQADRVAAASSLARDARVVVVLKGQRSVVADPGGRVAVTDAGTPGLATGGTGDVLSGVAGALVARLDPWTAATAAVHLHGRAGEVAARGLGEDGVVATDVAESLPRAIVALAAVRGGGASGR
jgi:hydroxyethylthiazole kinase-like uncharacterized protein yjeF